MRCNHGLLENYDKKLIQSLEMVMEMDSFFNLVY
jgi:hypothetical protein